MKNVVLYVLIMLFFTSKSFAKEIILYTNISPPYQEKQGDEVTGLSIDILKCVFDKLDLDYKVNITPWLRAKINVKDGLGAGFFTAGFSKETEEYATLSAPLALEKWYWYFTDPLLKKDKIGVIRGSTQDEWLAENSTSEVIQVNKFNQLFQMVKSNRVSAFLSDKKTFDNHIKLSQIDASEIKSKFFKYTPLGVYFSNKFLASSTNVLNEFNKTIPDCRTEAIRLSEKEKQIIHNIAKSQVITWLNHSTVFDAIKAQNQKHLNMTEEQIIELDNEWRSQEGEDIQPLIDGVLNNELSTYLKKIQLSSNGLYSEIFVVDNKGLNVGQSSITSDYWQGDEAKFKNSFQQGSGTIFIDDIEYDSSSRKFQSQVSMTISDPDSDLPLGAITLGIDVEKALSETGDIENN
ncbi:substrate-binding periplasmic protein [Vibrio pectenicida]|uniref:substrate-binding periplasmic protein n=1 Tax=Vibrio pectenicida TaxID=62763 RepID=UPI003B9D0FEA